MTTNPSKHTRRSGRSFSEQLAALDSGASSAVAGKQHTVPRRPENGFIERLVVSPSTPSGAFGPELMTVVEVALILRFTERHVRGLITDGELKALLLGAAVRIRRTDFDDYLDKCARPRARKSKAT